MICINIVFASDVFDKRKKEAFFPSLSLSCLTSRQQLDYKLRQQGLQELLQEIGLMMRTISKDVRSSFFNLLIKSMMSERRENQGDGRQRDERNKCLPLDLIFLSQQSMGQN